MTIREYNYIKVMSNGFENRAKISFTPNSTKVKCLEKCYQSKDNICVYYREFECDGETISDAITKALTRMGMSSENFINEETYSQE